MSQNGLHMDNLSVQIPTLDLNQLTAQTLGDRTLEHQLLALFRTQARHILESLQDPAITSPAVNADFVHLLRGSALAIGATRVAAMAAAYETLAVSPNQGLASNALTALNQAIRDAIAAIDRHIGPA